MAEWEEEAGLSQQSNACGSVLSPYGGWCCSLRSCVVTDALHLTSDRCNGSRAMLQRVACAAGLAGRALAQLGSNGQLAQQATTSAAVGAQQVFQRLSFATNSHDIFNVHRESGDNNWNTEFDFTNANYKKVSTCLRRHSQLSLECPMVVGYPLEGSAGVTARYLQRCRSRSAFETSK